ncbi:MAG: DUF3592 domain-containing protein [Acetatifactor sp.]
MKKKRNGGLVEVIIFAVFAIVGIGLFIGGVFFLKSSLEFKKIAKETTATISEIRTSTDSDGDIHHSVYVTYKVNGDTYKDRPLNFYSSGMYEGKKMTILYDPNNPNRIGSASNNIFTTALLMGMGLIFGSVGAIPLLLRAKKSSKRNRLRENGKVLHAKVVNIDINRSYSVNGRHPYFIICEYQDEYSGKTYRFKSENIWQEVVLNSMDEQYIDVFVNPGDFSQYTVDVEGFLNRLQSDVIDYT